MRYYREARFRPSTCSGGRLARASGDRERDVDRALSRRVVDSLRLAGASLTWIRMVEQVTELDESDERHAFGESLPPGLRLIH